MEAQKTIAQRDYRFDNLKGLLIFLVVVGHVISHFNSGQSTLASYLYVIIYSFHMPAFIFVSGYFSKPRAGETAQRHNEKILTSSLFPFFIFHTLMWVLGYRTLTTYMTPTWTMWYLLSLFFWKAAIPSLSRIRFLLPASIFFSLLVCVTEASELLALSKTVSFFPFFIAGYLMDKSMIERVRRYGKAAAIAAMALSICAVVLMVRKGYPMSSVFKMKASYESIGLTNITCVLLRAFGRFVGFQATFSLLGFIPDKETLLTKLGRTTMTVYLGHSYIIKITRKVFSFMHLNIAHNDIVFLLFIILFSTVTCIVCGNRYVVKAYNAVMTRINQVLLVKKRVE